MVFILLAVTLACLPWVCRTRWLPLGWLGLCSQIIAIDPQFISDYDLLGKSASLVVAWIKSLATAAWCSFCSGSRSCRMKFATTHFMPKSCVKILDIVAFGIPGSAPSSRTVSHRSSLITACTYSAFSGLLFVAGLPEHGSPSTNSRPSLKRLCHTFTCAVLIAYSLKAF